MEFNGSGCCQGICRWRYKSCINWDVLLNPAEKFIILGLFEGIGANTKIAYKDFDGLTIDLFDIKSHKLHLNNRLIDFSDELYTIAKEAADTFETIVYDMPTEDGIKISWWWILVILILGAIGKKMYDDHMEKQKALAEARNDDREEIK